MLYAIVDIETTGSYAAGNGITEVAIVIHDGTKVLDFYETLVNPHRQIPYFIKNLTGITDEMVAHAPSFNEVAEHIYRLLQDKVFVAHNVNFDYSFLKHHLSDVGYELNTKKLCTVRLARKIIPGMRSYSLGKLCHQVGINLTDAHRAGGDAKATAELFALLVSKDEKDVIKSMMKGRSTEQYIPPNVPVEQVQELPDTAGVYYFYNEKGKVVYVGKAKNLARRVRSHFSNNKPSRQKQDFLREIHRISYKECATELMASILESSEIRRLWPAFNRSQHGFLPRFGLFAYEDQNGYMRLGIEKYKQHFKAIYTFNTLIEGHNRLRHLIEQFELCARLCNLVKTDDCSDSMYADSCAGACSKKENVEAYNDKVSNAITWLLGQLPTFALLDKGINTNEQSCILMKHGNFFGMGYVKNENELENLSLLEQKLEPYQDSDYVRNLIIKHAADNPEKMVTF